MHEILVVEESQYLRELRESAEKCRRAANNHAANFLGTDSPVYRALKLKAQCYDFIADTLEMAPKTQP